MVNKSLSPTHVESQEIMVVEDEDQVVKDQSAMDEVEAEIETEPTQIKMVFAMKGI
jgi:hypothetical protein